MGIPQPDPHTFHHHEPQVEKATQTYSRRCPQLDKVICRCRTGCACCQSRDNEDACTDRSCSPPRDRGRSPTPRYPEDTPIQSRPFPLHRTHSPTDTASISGQEGVEDHHLVEREIGDLGNHTLHSIHLSLARHTAAWPQAPYNSPAESMAPGARSGSASIMSSCYLPSLPSTEALLGFIGDGVGGSGIAPRDEDVATYMITPLVLNYEVNYSMAVET